MDFYAKKRLQKPYEKTFLMILCIFVDCLVSKILVKNQKLLTLNIHGRKAPLYTKISIYIPLRISPYTGQKRYAVDNKVNF